MPVDTSSPVGPEEVWAILRELAEQSKETDRLIKELRESQKETDRQFKETDRQFKETDIRFKETDRQFKETARKFQESKAENDRLLQESRAEHDRQMRQLDQKLGRLGGRLGEFVQEMVRPAVVRLFQAQGIEVHEVHPNVTLKRDGIEAEIDLFVVNDGISIAVECKSHCSIDDVNDHIDRLKNLKFLLPYYETIKVMGGVAAMVMPDDVARYAYKKGLYVLAQSGETMLVRNDEKFKPVMW
jgi:hypothetical protein